MRHVNINRIRGANQTSLRFNSIDQNNSLDVRMTKSLYSTKTDRKTNSMNLSIEDEDNNVLHQSPERTVSPNFDSTRNWTKE